MDGAFAPDHFQFHSRSTRRTAAESRPCRADGVAVVDLVGEVVTGCEGRFCRSRRGAAGDFGGGEEAREEVVKPEAEIHQNSAPRNNSSKRSWQNEPERYADDVCSKLRKFHAAHHLPG